MAEPTDKNTGGKNAAGRRAALGAAYIRRQIVSSPDVIEMARHFGGPGMKNPLGYAAALFWTWLLLWKDDDYLLTGDLAVLRSRVFPAFPEVSSQNVHRFLDFASEKSMVLRYEVGGRPYLYFVTAAKHNPAPRGDRYIPSELPPPPGVPAPHKLATGWCQDGAKSAPTRLPLSALLSSAPLSSTQNLPKPLQNPEFAVANLDPDPERQAILQASIELGDFSKAEPLGVDRAAWNVLRRGWQRSQISPGGEA